MPAPRRRPDPTPRRLRRLAAFIVAAGWFAAAILLTRASGRSGTDAVSYEIVGDRIFPFTLADSRRERQQLQRLEGNMGVWIAEFDRGLETLTRPPGLGWTVLALSTAVGLGLLRLAALGAEDEAR